MAHWPKLRYQTYFNHIFGIQRRRHPTLPDLQPRRHVSISRTAGSLGCVSANLLFTILWSYAIINFRFGIDIGKIAELQDADAARNAARE